MAKVYPTIPTFTAGAVLTAAEMNDIGTAVNNHTVPPMCRAVRTTDASYTSTTAFTWQSVASGNKGFDTDGMFSAGSPTRITFSTAGVYRVTFGYYITGTSSTYSQGYIRLGGSAVIAEMDAGTATTSTILSQVSVDYEFTAAQYVEGQVVVNGTALTQKGTGVPSFFSAVFLGKTA